MAERLTPPDLEVRGSSLARCVVSFNRQGKLFHFVSLHQCVYVVVQFYSWFKFYFPLFLGMVMYDNEFETKENKI